MSTADVFMSSSPPRPNRSNPHVVASSSSPGIPALDDIFTSKAPPKSALRSGSNAAPIPANAPTAFTSAADVFREAPDIDIDTENITTSPSPKKKPARKKQSDKPVATKSARIPKDASKPPKSRATKDKPSDKNAIAGQSAKSDQTKSTVLQGRVTKPSTGSKKSETVSRHFADAPSKPKAAPKQRKTAPSKQSSNPPKVPNDALEEDEKAREERPATPEHAPQLPALARRNDWTPPPADKSVVVLDSESDNRELLSSTNKPAKSRGVFKTLQDQYGCKEAIGQEPQEPREQEHQADPAKQPRESEVLRKRKAIETISLESACNVDPKVPRERTPNKPAPAKRKIKTITELATAPYAMAPEADFDITLRSTRDSLLGYFDDGSDIKALIENQAVSMDISKEKGKGKGKAKPAKEPKRKRKTGTANQPILLSPNSALKQSSVQDFVFGTSSQLMREDSPSHLRDLQLAIQASNQNDVDPFEDEDSQGLWHAGARDGDGDLLCVEFVDLAGATVVPKFQRPTQPASKSSEVVQKREDSPNCDRTLDLEDILDASDIERESRNAAKDQEKSHPSPLEPAPIAQNTEPPVAIDKRDTTKPNFELLTDLQLSRQVASYGFKPIKRRQGMIALLDKCWTSKNVTATVGSTHTISTTATSMSPKRKAQTGTGTTKAATGTTTSPSRPRGRPRKDSSMPPPPPSAQEVPATKPRKSTSPKRKTQKAAAAAAPPPPASPRKPRGQSSKKKTEEVSAAVAPSKVTTVATAAAKKAKSPQRKPRKASPKRNKPKPTPANTIEIADSDDEVLDLDDFDDSHSILSHHSTSSLERLLTPPPASSPPPPPPAANNNNNNNDDEEDKGEMSQLLRAETTSSPSNQQQEQTKSLLHHVTRAITSAPRTSDPNHPSWHEKMLIYDPVVLEDLASWLNSGQLSRVGFDGEVSPQDVKAWCESKSVVCLWRQTGRGMARSRF